MNRVLVICGLLLSGSMFEIRAQEIGSALTNQIQSSLRQKQALKINDAIYQAVGFGNTFMVTTPEGNVIIDTSLPVMAKHHVELLKAVNNGPVKYIILTHGHGDHTGGVALWKETGTQIIAQKNSVEFTAYQRRLGRFFAIRNAAQFIAAPPPPDSAAANATPGPEPTILFDDHYHFRLGGVDFEIYHTPGETPDHLTVWVPKYKAAFTGDNYYESFPNMYTLRGTEPRWPLEYIASLNRAMALKPEILLPSHGRVVQGSAEIQRRLTQYRDAIQYVHDAVVKGMNAGQDVFTLMREVRLPPALEVGESYGKLTWSIRGIYEGYAGWFDMNPATMYETPASSVYGDVARLAGGAARLTELALQQIQQGKNVEALHVTEIELAAEPHNRAALEARLQALTSLRAKSQNSNEQGWLDYSIRQTRQQIAAVEPPPAAHFHHVHLNSTDPKAAIDFYTSKFDCERAKFTGVLDAVWAQKSWLLFTKVAAAPKSEITSAIWHIGWGAEKMPEAYQKQLDSGTKFATPITDISDIGGGTAKGVFFYAYVDGPDHQLIELNTSRNHNFGHIHMLSKDPVAAGEWYAKELGLKSRSSSETRMYKGFQIGPSASLTADNVNIIIFPWQYAQIQWPELWKDRTEFESTKGHVTDHIGFSVDNLDETIARLKKDGVNVTDEPRSVLGGKLKIAFIEGPDKVRIELVEGQAKKE